MKSQNNVVDSLINSAFDNSEAVNGMLNQFNLNWTVEKQPLFLADGTKSPFFGIVRSDNKHIFAATSGQYQTFQNSELVDMLLKMSELTGYEIHNGGHLSKGAYVYMQFKSPNVLTNLGENKTSVQGYLTGLNSHNGKGNLKWGETNITVCCCNTFAAAMAELKNASRHTANILQRVQQGINDINSTIEAEQKMFENFKRLAEIPMNNKHLRNVVLGITKVDIKLDKDSQREEFGGRAVNNADKLLESITNETAYKGSTLWGLFSGVTHYTSHVMSISDERLDSQLISTGTAYRHNNAAFDTLISMAKL